MRITKEWTYHIVLAIFLLIMDFFGDYVVGGKQELLNNFKPEYLGLLLSFYFVSASIYLINFKFVCPKYLKKNRVHQFVFVALGLVGLFVLLRYVLEEVILFQITGFHNYYDHSRRLYFYVFDNSFYAIKPILYSTLIYLAIKFIGINDHNQAELNLLKSQISPHFLFNTLNAFYVDLIDEKPETANDIHKLSELLRYVTYDSQKDLLPLKHEIKFLKDYIHFFKKRFENEFSVEFKVSGEVKNQEIPSLILIHFIENLFKHGIVNDKTNPASIHINIQDHYIELTTKNKILTSEKFMESGIGTYNVKRRLSALFNSNYTLVYNNKMSYFNTYLKMPL